MKFLIDNIWLIFCALLSGGALLWPSIAARGSKLSLVQATQMLNQDRAVVVDVRDPKDYAAGHMREARNIPMKELPKRVGELDRFKSKAVIVVCNSGVQSGRAGSVLKKAGFNEVFSLNGGMAAWQAQGLPITK